MNINDFERRADENEKQPMREALACWSAVPRGAISEHSKNARPVTEGSLRSQWAAFPGKAPGWREGLVAGNGRQGLVLAGAPWDEVLIYQNVSFVIPTPHPRFTPPGDGAMLPEARTHVLSMDDDWLPERGQKTTVYPFHPGEQLRIRQAMGAVERYERATVMDRSELTVDVKTGEGDQRERHFVSAEDDVVLSEFESVNKNDGMTLQISPDLPEEMEGYGWWKFGIAPETRMSYRLFADEKNGIIGLLARYPEYEGSELAGCGFMTVSRVLTDGRLDLTWESVQTCHLATAEGRPLFSVSGARKAQIISRSAVIRNLGRLEDDLSGRLDQKASSDNAIYAEVKKLDSFAKKYSCKRSGLIDYDRAIARHAGKWHERMHRQELSIESEESAERASLKALLAQQKKQETLSGALLKRLYRLGRYIMLCCAGYTAPRLCGMWTGEWNPAWSGAYTMDANVNLQVSGMNAGNAPEAAAGYCAFVQRQIPDWMENARLVYGIKDALLVPVNTDGLRAMMVEYDSEYPFEYWNAGAAWMIRPVFEAWQCFGDIAFGENERILEDLLRPLLRCALHFWEQYVTPEYYIKIDGKPAYEPGKAALRDGERYLLIPGYSPENHPGGRKSAICMNAAMDICAARDTLNMLRTLETECPSEQSERILQRCDALEEGLPQYLTDETGALKEWASEAYKENNAHRHLSHLYCAWPSFEADNNAALAQACVQAVLNRDRENEGKDDTPSHGWIHKMLILARLRQKDALTLLLRKLLTTDVIYATGMTDHNTDRSRGVFCTDTLLGLQGILQEMLLYSDGERIEILPLLPDEWRAGSVTGLMTRSGVCVDRLTWDSDKGVIEAVLHMQKHFRGTIAIGLEFQKQGYARLSDTAQGALEDYPAGTRLSIFWSRERTEQE